jgi:hypothetical protein
MEASRYSPPLAPVEAPDAPPAAPALWNPGAALAWSLLFTPLFGAWLHMRNWQAMGEPEKAAGSQRWMIGILCFWIALAGVAMLGPPLGDAWDWLSRAGGLGMLLAWWIGSAHAQSSAVAQRYGSDYPRKSWIAPVLAAIGAWAAFAVVLMMVIFAIGAAMLR